MKKLLFIILLMLTMCFCGCFQVDAGSSVESSSSSLEEEKQEELIVTNIEDFIGGDVNNIRFKRGGIVLQGRYTKTDANYIACENYPLITSNATKKNKYSGNMHIQYERAHPGYGISFSSDKTTRDTILSFRTTYERTDGGVGFMCRSTKTHQDDWIHNNDGYAFVIFQEEVVLKRVLTRVDNILDGKANGLGVVPIKNVSFGQDVIITYGSCTNEENNVVLVFKMDKVEEDGSVQNVVDYQYIDKSGNKIEDTSATNMHIAFYATSMYIGGIEEVIFGRNYAIQESVATGTLLSAISLESGYQWLDTTKTIEDGVSSYAAISSYSYFGKNVKESCSVIINGRNL